jgi:formylglycine-generating enzyme required for sulfatase activity
MIGLETIFNCTFVTFAAEMTQDKIHTNSIGMGLIKIEPGIFFMGFEEALLSDELVGDEPHRWNGDFDGHPTYQVTISKSFHMGGCQVTNAQYEQFAPEHRELQGKHDFSKGDEDAVVFVSWHEAIRFFANGCLRKKDCLIGCQQKWSGNMLVD